MQLCVVKLDAGFWEMKKRPLRTTSLQQVYATSFFVTPLAPLILRGETLENLPVLLDLPW